MTAEYKIELTYRKKWEKKEFKSNQSKFKAILELVKVNEFKKKKQDIWNYLNEPFYVNVLRNSAF